MSGIIAALEILFIIPLPQDLFVYSHSNWGTGWYYGNKLRDATFVGLFVLLHIYLMGCSTAHYLCCSLFRFMRLHICKVKITFTWIPVEINFVLLFRLIWSCGDAICNTSKHSTRCTWGVTIERKLSSISTYVHYVPLSFTLEQNKQMNFEEYLCLAGMDKELFWFFRFD
jgi:hypothetical protein